MCSLWKIHESADIPDRFEGSGRWNPKNGDKNRTFKRVCSSDVVG